MNASGALSLDLRSTLKRWSGRGESEAPQELDSHNDYMPSDGVISGPRPVAAKSTGRLGPEHGDSDGRTGPFWPEAARYADGNPDGGKQRLVFTIRALGRQNAFALVNDWSGKHFEVWELDAQEREVVRSSKPNLKAGSGIWSECSVKQVGRINQRYALAAVRMCGAEVGYKLFLIDGQTRQFQPMCSITPDPRDPEQFFSIEQVSEQYSVAVYHVARPGADPFRAPRPVTTIHSFEPKDGKGTKRASLDFGDRTVESWRVFDGQVVLTLGGRDEDDTCKFDMRVDLSL